LLSLSLSETAEEEEVEAKSKALNSLLLHANVTTAAAPDEGLKR
jgi:hypothetical protein